MNLPTYERGRSRSRVIYLRCLRRHAHELIAMGYALLTPAGFWDTDEPAITGELVDCVRKAMQAQTAPSWVARYAIRDDPPLRTPGRQGKERYRIDVEIERVCRGVRPMFRFEAKRLGPAHPAANYLGNEGLGRFVSGQYPVRHGEAGMLGYVQSENEESWASRISQSLAALARDLALRKNGGWRPVTVVAGLRHVYRTGHLRSSDSSPLDIYHVLLRFH